MTRKRPRTFATKRSICHWNNDDDDDDAIDIPVDTVHHQYQHQRQQLTLNTFFVRASRTKRRVAPLPSGGPANQALSTLTAPAASHTQGIVPQTPPTPSSTSQLLRDARTPPTESPLMLANVKTPPTPPLVTFSTATRTTKKKKLKQVYLDCGQSVFGQQLCQKCGMLYMPGVSEDMKAHDTMCREKSLGVPWRPIKGQRIYHPQHGNTGSIRASGNTSTSGTRRFEDKASSEILSVPIPTNPITTTATYMVLESVYRHVSRDLGLDTTLPSNITNGSLMESLAGYTVWLFLRDQRVVGFVATQPIAKAFQLVMPPATSTMTTETTASATRKEEEYTITSKEGSNQQQHEKTTTTATTAYSLLSSTTAERIPRKAMLGVAILWTHENFRGQGIATQLVDTAREHAFFGMVVPTHQLAFSSPTQAGWNFGRKYCGRDGKDTIPLLYEYRPLPRPKTNQTNPSIQDDIVYTGDRSHYR